MIGGASDTVVYVLQLGCYSVVRAVIDADKCVLLVIPRKGLCLGRVPYLFIPLSPILAPGCHSVDQQPYAPFRCSFPAGSRLLYTGVDDFCVKNPPSDEDDA